MAQEVETATIMFTDLVASTELRSRVGDHAADLLQREHDSLVTAAVETHGGRVVKSLGDGLMAIFTSAAQAINCAAAAQQAIDRHNLQSHGPEPLHIRVGLAAGDVNVEEGDCFGTPVVQAARLCAKAGADQILVSNLVRMLAGNRVEVTFAPLGPLELRGLPEAVDTVEVVWVRAQEAQGLPLPSYLVGEGRATFHGRSADFANLQERWELAQTGRRQVVLVSGEPGIGKTRLAAELAKHASESGATVLLGRIAEDIGGPYQPFAEAVSHVVLHRDPQDLRRTLGRHPGELTRIVPEIGEVVPDLPAPLRADPATEQYRLTDAVASWLGETARDRPVVFVVDDFHWASAQTALMLRHVAAELEASPLMIVVTFRDTDLQRDGAAARAIADMGRFSGVTRLALSGLSSVDVVALIASLSGVDHGPSLLKLADAVRDHTEGNAFFVGELIRHLAETGQLVAGEPCVVDPERMLSLPASVRGVVVRRIERLSDVTRDILTHAAVVGRDFDLRLMTSILGPDAPIVDAATEATEAHILEERGVGRYHFVHGLVITALLDELGETRRARLHYRIALAMENLNPHLREVRRELAHHYASAGVAGDLTRAVESNRVAASDAIEQLAFEEASNLLGLALGLLDELGRDPLLECDLLTELAHAQVNAGNPAAAKTAAAAAKLAKELEDDERLARVALVFEIGLVGAIGRVDAEHVVLLEDAIARSGALSLDVQARLHADLALGLMFSADPTRTRQVSDEALALARASESDDTIGRVLSSRYPTIWNATTLDERLKIVSELAEVATRRDNPSLGFLASANGMLAALEDGDIALACERLARADALANDLGQPQLKWFAAVCSAKRALVQGELDVAERLIANAFELGSAAGRADATSYFAAQSFCLGFLGADVGHLRARVDEAVARNPGVPAFRAMRATLHAELGDIEAARSELASIADDGFALPQDFTWLVGLCFCAHAAAVVADRSAASVLYKLIEPYGDHYADAGSTWYGSAHQYLGELAIVLEDCDTARRHLQRAGAAHAKVGCDAMSARTLLAGAKVALMDDVDRSSGRADLERAASIVATRGLVGLDAQVALLHDLYAH